MTIAKKVILFMDIRNSSKLWSVYDNKILKCIKKIHKIIENKLKKIPHAFIFKIVGDSFMIVFKNVLDSIKFSMDISKILTDKKTSIYLDSKKKDKITIRIGICYGNVNYFKTKVQNCQQIDYFGNIVNIASRMETAVSPINGFAIAFTEDKENDIPKIQKLIEKDSKFSIKPLNLKKIKKIDKTERSGKLLHNLFFINENLENLKGIKINLKVLKVTNTEVTEEKSMSLF
tara:strand:+ start:194 stop:886 length:693 start_codon:yes stop_codon:yes gene_type:complete